MFLKIILGILVKMEELKALKTHIYNTHTTEPVRGFFSLSKGLSPKKTWRDHIFVYPGSVSVNLSAMVKFCNNFLIS